MPYIRRLLIVLLLALAVGQMSAAAVAAQPEAADALSAYVTQADGSYSWKVRHRFRLGQSDCVELTMVSQTWKEIVWKHRMFVVIPDSVKNATDALLVIEGGRWRDQDEQPLGDNEFKAPGKAVLLAGLAEKLEAPMVIVLNVPQQPVFNGKNEDAIIAYTFDKFMRTGEKDWPLLLPMVKSAVRAMDTAQAFLKEDRHFAIERFLVTGASKRGWTTWLTAATDKRVMALVPMVIDMLNMNEQLPHQKAAWGEFSPSIHDYTDINLASRIGSDHGQQLVRIVDPYAYREQITQPKLLILGTNDSFWTLDALNLYWDGLAGDKYVSYVPNAGHNLANDWQRIFGGILSLRQHATSNRAMPKLQWQYEATAQGFTLTVTPGEAVMRVTSWSTTSASHDFRKSKWTPRELKAENDGSYIAHITRSPEGVNAGYVEVVYGRPILPLSLSTTIRIVDGMNEQASNKASDAK